MEYPCPCCGNILEDDEPHNWGICSVCMWEDDPVQFDDPDYAGGANDISLNLYRELFFRYRAEIKLGDYKWYKRYLNAQ